MNKFIAFSALSTGLMVLASCGGSNNEVAEPVEEATAWSVTGDFDTNGEATGREITNYGVDGKVVSVDVFTADKTTKELVKTDHIIYQNGKPAFGKALKPDGTVEGRDIYTYDEKGNVTEEVVETYSEGLKRIAPIKRYVYTYDANGDVTSIKEQSDTPKGWATDYEWTYNYDAQARLTSRADYTGEGKERTQSCQYTWSYQEGCNKIKQLDFFTFDIKQQKLKHDSKTFYEYNAAGQVTEAKVVRHKNTQKREDINSRLFTYEYNAAGQTTSIQEQKWNNTTKTWYEVTSTSFEYDNAGQLVRKQFIKSTNRGMKFMTDVYVQDSTATAPVVAPAAPALVVKPVINLEGKHLTSVEED